MRRNVIYVVATLAVVVGSFVGLMVTNTHPSLGLDLQGGISVVLAPTGKATNEQLSIARDIIDKRVNSLGIAEPQIRVEGGNIVIDLPGVKDADRARKLVGQTAQLEFRPVISDVWDVKSVKGNIPGAGTTTTAAGSTTTAAPGESTTTATANVDTSSTAPGGGPGKSRAAQTPTVVAPAAPGTTQAAVPATDAAPTPGTDAAPTAGSDAAPTPGTDAPPTTAAAPAGTSDLAARLLAAGVEPTCSGIGPVPSLSPDTVTPEQQGVFPGRYEKREVKVKGVKLVVEERCVYTLGPARLTGSDLSSAKAETTQTGPAIGIKFKDEGFKKWNAVAAELFPKQPPQNQVAIVLDNEVLSAPRFQTSSFNDNGAQITGSFTDTEASDIARKINYGALPVKLKELTVSDISPTLGKDQLTAGIVAGAIGLALVMIYMIVFYRILGFVVLLGVTLSFLATYVIITWLGVVLTLAGVVGLIVSVGVTVDSYVVYFERLKDEVRKGKTVRSSLNESYRKSWSTIITADLVSIIAAAVLYFLTSGSVRGFALLLGIATLLDLIISYTFMYPLVAIMCRRPGLIEARWIGIGSGLEAAEAHANDRVPEEVGS